MISLGYTIAYLKDAEIYFLCEKKIDQDRFYDLVDRLVFSVGQIKKPHSNQNFV
jgi:hypothetical protein